MQKLLLMILVLLSPILHASLSYYPENIQSKLNTFSINAIDIQSPLEQQILREDLFNVLNGIHQVVENSTDLLVEECPTNANCYSHNGTLSYKEARELMFGKLFLEKNNQNKYFVKDLYCEKNINELDGAGPLKIPNPNVANCEHTWPQSKFNPNMNTNMQKVDLHHLFPVDNRANSVRSNHLFGEIDFARETHENCQVSSIGTIKGTNTTGFTPPKTHRGNVARAIFYFAVRYKMPIPNEQEVYLKKWDKEDPVDSEEQKRNDEIFKIQGNRNPFIDFPRLGSILIDL